MRTKYPNLNSWVIVESESENTVHLRDLLFDEEYLFPAWIVGFIKKLDGKTDPYTIDSKLSRKVVDTIIQYLDEESLIYWGKWRHFGTGTITRPIIVVREKHYTRALARILNMVLACLWLPCLLTGGIAFAHHPHIGDLSSLQYYMVGVVIVLFAGLLHELAHAMASFAYGGIVVEMGVQVMWVFPGFYVAMNNDPIPHRLQKIQTHAAGVEMNLLLAGVGLLLASKGGVLEGVSFVFAVINTVLGLLNLTFFDSFDGCKIMGDLMGDEDCIGVAKSIVFKQKKRRKVCRRGINGYLYVVNAVILLLSQAVGLLLIALFLTEVFS